MPIQQRHAGGGLSSRTLVSKRKAPSVALPSSQEASPSHDSNDGTVTAKKTTRGRNRNGNHRVIAEEERTRKRTRTNNVAIATTTVHKGNVRHVAKLQRVEQNAWESEVDEESNASESAIALVVPLGSGRSTSPASSGEISWDTKVRGTKKKLQSRAKDSQTNPDVLNIRSHSQLQDLMSDPRMVSFLEPSLRMKPRKPIRPTISVVF